MTKKVIIITGASSGIGLALAKEYDKKDINIVLAARSIDKLDTLKSELKNNVLTIKTDVSIQSDCENLINKTIEKFGRIDILINNAGISMRSLIIDTNIDVIKRVMDVNFWGTVYCTKYSLPHILKTKGSIIAVSSIAGFKGLPARVGYSSSKFAIHGFIDVLRMENLKTGVHVLLVTPGFTHSEIRKNALLGDGSKQGKTPRNEDKMMTAERVAYRIRLAIDKRRRKLIFTSQGKLIFFLNNISPKFLDRAIYKGMSKEPDSPFK
jgi:short-subunit dehydrogenase